jgi:hypothetical protein
MINLIAEKKKALQMLNTKNKEKSLDQTANTPN